MNCSYSLTRACLNATTSCSTTLCSRICCTASATCSYRPPLPPSPICSKWPDECGCPIYETPNRKGVLATATNPQRIALSPIHYPASSIERQQCALSCLYSCVAPACCVASNSIAPSRHIRPPKTRSAFTYTTNGSSASPHVQTRRLQCPSVSILLCFVYQVHSLTPRPNYTTFIHIFFKSHLNVISAL